MGLRFAASGQESQALHLNRQASVEKQRHGQRISMDSVNDDQMLARAEHYRSILFSTL